ncbi:MAG: HEAT repeat domain-containing protein [Candidatus Cloacimonetes bacterium]|nr:HEAT repeat domain-containing protein [Candidatus Cloacimonadota bacterium]
MMELNESEQYELFYELARSLSHPLREVRISAVSAISRIANRRCTNTLLDKLELEKDTFIKASLLRILGDIGTENLVTELGRYLSHPEPRIRANAIESFTRIRVSDKMTLVKYLKPLIHDENNRVASTALKEVIALGETACLPYLKLFLKGTDPSRKASAIWVVGELDLKDCLEDVIYALYSENYQVHSIAHRVLGKNPEQAIPILFENLAMGDSVVKVYTFLFFAKNLKAVDEKQKELLLSMLEVEESYIASFILKILFQLRLEEGFELLKMNLASQDLNLRKVAVEGMTHYLGRPDIYPVLLKATRDEKESRLLGILVHYFSHFPDAQSVEMLKDYLGHEDRRVRANAIEVLGQIGDERVKQILMPFLEDSNNRILANAAIALFRLGEKKVLQKLKDSMASKDDAVRVSASYAMGQIQSRELADVLLEGLLDDVKKVRENVLKGLMKEDKEGFSRLISSLRSTTGINARKALAEVTLSTTVDPSVPVVSEALAAYAEQVNVFEIPESLEPQEVDKLESLLFAEESSLRIYATFVLGEKQIQKALPKLICLLYERDDEIVAETLMALKKLKMRESLVFLRDIYSRLSGENMRLCASIMQELAEGTLKRQDFPANLSLAHNQALESHARPA